MRSADEMIARALEIDPQLLPYAAELLQDLEELGSDAGLVVRLLSELALPPGARVLDLGCGKWATAISIARALGLPVFGIDLFAPFVEHARQVAGRAGVAHLCTFVQGDLRTVPARYPSVVPADVGVFAALGDVLGTIEETVGILRRAVRPGGYLLICDDYVRPGGSVAFAGFEGYRSREATSRALEAHGDALLRVVEEADDAVAEAHRRDNAHIRRRAEALAARHPESREALLKFADDQEAETAFLESNVVSALWVLERR